MYSLNKKQVDIIVADVQQASITLSHLADDLIDHICCEVENLISSGKSFDQAYELVKKETGIEVLQKIQDNTKFLIDKNYRLMKTTMKVTGNISLAILGIATVFKIMHWPGAGIGFVLGFFMLCAVFFPLAVYSNYKYVSNKKNLFLHISILVGGISFMIGVLFKVQHWPGAGIQLFVGYMALFLLFLPSLLFVKVKQAQSSRDKRIYILGVISILIYGVSNMFKMFHWPGASILMVLGAFLLIAVFLPLFTWRRIQLEGKITGQFVFTITISMFFILFTSLIALNVSRNVLDSFVVQANNKTYINDYLRNRNEALLNSIESKKDTLELHSNAVSIKSATDDLNDFINNIQTSLIMRVEGVDKANAVQLMNTVERIMAKDNMDASYLELIGEGNNGKAYELKQKIEQYRLMLVSYAGEADSKRIGSLLDTSFDGIPDGYKTWEESKFSGSALINTLCILKGLQSDINMAESIALNSLLSKSNNL